MQALSDQRAAAPHACACAPATATLSTGGGELSTRRMGARRRLTLHQPALAPLSTRIPTVEYYIVRVTAGYVRRAWLRLRAITLAQMISSSSMSKSMSVFGGTNPGKPRSPHACPAGMVHLARMPRESCETASSRPGTTCPHPSRKRSGRPRFREESHIVPLGR